MGSRRGWQSSGSQTYRGMHAQMWLITKAKDKAKYLSLISVRILLSLELYWPEIMMTEEEIANPTKKHVPGEGSSKLVLSADNRDAIVKSLLNKLSEAGKEKSGTPPPRDPGEKDKHLRLSRYLATRSMPTTLNHVSCSPNGQLPTAPLIHTSLSLSLSLSLSRTGRAALGRPPDAKAPATLPLIGSSTTQPCLTEAWASIFEQHFKHKPSKASTHQRRFPHPTQTIGQQND